MANLNKCLFKVSHNTVFLLFSFGIKWQHHLLFVWKTLLRTQYNICIYGMTLVYIYIYIYIYIRGSFSEYMYCITKNFRRVCLHALSNVKSCKWRQCWLYHFSHRNCGIPSGQPLMRTGYNMRFHTLHDITHTHTQTHTHIYIYIFTNPSPQAW